MNKTSYRNRARANFRVVEAELYAYKDSLKELIDWKNGIYDRGGKSDLPIRAKGHGDQTLSKVCSIMMDKHFMEQERRIKAIQKTMELLKENHPEMLKLLELLYFIEGNTTVSVSRKLNISEATLYRWRKALIKLIADELGFMI